MNGADAIRAIALFLALSFSPAVANPQIEHAVPPDTMDGWHTVSGNELYSTCESSEADEQARCIAYIVGASDMIGDLETAVDLNGKSYWKYHAICLPKDATAQQIRDVVVKYLKNYPEKRARAGAGLVMVALIAAWSCPAK
jgi:hypothetical protein